jgi:hypothetical protein
MRRHRTTLCRSCDTFRFGLGFRAAAAREEGAVGVRDAVEPPSETTAERSRRPRFGRALGRTCHQAAPKGHMHGTTVRRRVFFLYRCFTRSVSPLRGVLSRRTAVFGRAARRFRTSCPIGRSQPPWRARFIQKKNLRRASKPATDDVR